MFLVKNKMIPTTEPGLFIEKSGESFKQYFSPITLERWIIYGTCNQCGLCEVGAIEDYIIWISGKVPGEPYACYDKRVLEGRKDVPIRPELSVKMGPQCSLSGVYL